jgi:outer membrane lipoprotein-sorting protein
MKNIYKLIILLLPSIFLLFSANAQDITSLVQKVKEKMEKVNDYVAEGKMKTDVAFIKAPIGKVKIYFKKPDKFKLKRDAGISILPKGGITINIGSIISTNNFTVIDAGTIVLNGTTVKIAKLLPTNDNSDIILSTLYIDQEHLLVKKATTTTKENGTYDIEMIYGIYANFGLPDKLIFSFNTKNYKMPKGVTLEFDDNASPEEKNNMKNKKGRVEIIYSNYLINKGIDDSIFKN